MTETVELKRLEELRDWLVKRGEPDSGIRYEGPPNAGRGAHVQMYGPDATFIADHFHGEGARVLAEAITSLISRHPEAEQSATAGVVVKEIRWAFFDMAHDYGRGVWDGYTPFDTYTIQDCSEKYSGNDVFYCPKLSKSFATPEEAKAAVFEHYRVRILFAIESAPIVQEGEPFDPERTLKDALFKFVKAGVTTPHSYGGVLVADGQYARLRFDTELPGAHPQPPVPVEGEISIEGKTLDQHCRTLMSKIYNRGHSGLDRDCVLCQVYIAADRLLSFETGAPLSDEVRSWDARHPAPLREISDEMVETEAGNE